MQLGVIPCSWKIATVVPIFKKGVASKPANYRPISLTCTICKIFEAVIKSHLLSFITDNGLISPSQHGFLKGHSTCTNLLETFNNFSDFLNDCKDTLVAFTDFSRAFDCVSVVKLIYKLNSFGIRGSVLKCIESLLSGRSQNVKVGSTFSQIRPVISGVAQGSVLGPILFILYINDIVKCLPACSFSKFFADDMKSYMPIISDCSVNDFVTLLSSIEKWSNNWQLPLSVDKCNWMLISNRAPTQNLSFTLCGLDLTQVDEVKDLGVLFNSKLSFSSHVSEIVAKAKQRLFLLRKCFTCCDCSTLILAFKTYIIPMLEYCSPVWSPTAINEIFKIESIQRNFTKSFQDCSHLSYSERLTYCGLQSLEYRRLVADLVLFYKIVNSITTINLGESISPLTNSCTRGHSRRFKLLPVRLNSRLHFFSYRTVKVWNKLSDKTVCSGSVAGFKQCLPDENLQEFLTFGF